MSFETLSPDLHYIARVLISHYKRAGYKVTLEKPLWVDAPFRSTMICRKSIDTIALELRGNISIERYFIAFTDECIIRQERVRIFLVVGDDGTVSIPIEISRLLKQKGIGLLIVNGSSVEEYEKAIDCSMRIRLSESPSAGIYQAKLKDIEIKFNQGNYIDALRDLTEIVEESTTKLAKKVARKGRLAITETEVESLDLNAKINVLGAPTYKGVRQTRFLEDGLKQDLLSFKGTRNLSHHPRSARQRSELFRQAKERLLMGDRLIRTLCGKLRF